MDAREAIKAGHDIVFGRKSVTDFTDSDLIMICNTFREGAAQGVVMLSGCWEMSSSLVKEIRQRKSKKFHTKQPHEWTEEELGLKTFFSLVFSEQLS